MTLTPQVIQRARELSEAIEELPPEALELAGYLHDALDDLDVAHAELEDSAQDVLSLADKLMAIERMHPAGVSPPHELGNMPELCAGCDVFTITDDEPDVL